MSDNNNIIIYNTVDGKAGVKLYAQDGTVWMNQNQLAELFDTSVPNISMHISNILKEGELNKYSVIKDYLTTAADGRQYNVTFYALDMILAIGFRVRSKRGTQCRMGYRAVLFRLVSRARHRTMFQSVPGKFLPFFYSLFFRILRHDF